MWTREVLHGVELMSPRPAIRHAVATTRLGIVLGPYDQSLHGREEGDDGPPTGPGGWWFAFEPELHLERADDPIVPDIAGWRVDRVPELPDTAHCKIAPDWLCEALSPSTEAYDRSDKLEIYGAQGVPHVWLLSPIAKTLEAFRLQPGSGYVLVKTFRGKIAKAEPFTEVIVPLSRLWTMKLAHPPSHE